MTTGMAKNTMPLLDVGLVAASSRYYFNKKTGGSMTIDDLLTPPEEGDETGDVLGVPPLDDEEDFGADAMEGEGDE